MTLIVTGTTGGLTDLGTVSLHLATLWPHRVTVIEADPDGGRLAARHNWELRPGLAELAGHLRTPATSTLDPATLCREYRHHVSVVVAPPSAEQVIAALSVIGPNVRNIEQFLGGDIVIDVGRVRPNSPAAELIRQADIRLLITRTDLDDVVVLVHRQQLLNDFGLWKILAAGGRYTVKELSQAVELPVLADLLPGDRKSSASLRKAIATLANELQPNRLSSLAVV
ncbi:MAG: hypothetical protein NTW34_07860 [Actinobacteria bacterium]|nr:hypothetical protein [Actinomycetota bacterium]